MVNLALDALRRLAQSAIDCAAQNPLSKMLDLVPVVQLSSTRYVEFSPIKHKYLGVDSKGHHLYYIDAKDLLMVVSQTKQKTRTRRVKLKVRRNRFMRHYKPFLGQ